MKNSRNSKNPEFILKLPAGPTIGTTGDTTTAEGNRMCDTERNG